MVCKVKRLCYLYLISSYHYVANFWRTVKNISVCLADNVKMFIFADDTCILQINHTIYENSTAEFAAGGSICDSR